MPRRATDQTFTDAPIPRIKRANVTELAIESLLELIRRGVLRPGTALPPERQLVSQMGLSRTAIREALRGLASIGVIEITPGRGAFVRSISPEMLISPESLFFILEREALLQAIEVRRILEVEGIALAAERATGEDLDDMERILRHMEKAVHSSVEPLRFSADFHLAIAGATHNQVLSNMVKSFIRLIAQASPVIAERVPEAKELEYPQHAQLYEPILRHDPGEARGRMLQHLEVARRQILHAFPSQSPAPKGEEFHPSPSTTEPEEQAAKRH